MRSEEDDFPGIGRDAVTEKHVVRFDVVVYSNHQLSLGCRVRSMVAKNAATVSDLGDFQIVSVDE